MHEQSDGRAGEAARSGPSPMLIVLIVLAVLALIFVFQNSQETGVKFLFIDVRAPVWVALLITLVLGALLDRLITMWWRRRKRRDT